LVGFKACLKVHLGARLRASPENFSDESLETRCNDALALYERELGDLVLNRLVSRWSEDHRVSILIEEYRNPMPLEASVGLVSNAVIEVLISDYPSIFRNDEDYDCLNYSMYGFRHESY